MAFIFQFVNVVYSTCGIIHMCVLSLSHIRLSVTLWTIAHQAPLKLSYSTLAGPRDSPTPPPLLLVIVTTTPSYQVSHPFLRGSGNWSLYAHLLDCTSQAYKAYICPASRLTKAWIEQQRASPVAQR